MKRVLSLLSALMTCGVAFAMISTATAQVTNKGVATVVRMKGDARYMTANSPWKPLKVGDVVKPGSVIQTALDSGSYVDLVLTDENAPTPRPALYTAVSPAGTPAASSKGKAGSMPKAEQNTLRISENSALGIDKLTSTLTGADVVTDTQLDLKAGRIFGTVRKMTPASTYEIKLPNGVAGVRGTVYELTAEGVLRVLVGSVGFAHVADGGNVVTKIVGANNQYDSRTGQMSQLSPAAVDELSAFGMGMRFSNIQPPPVIYSADHTVHFVSPKGPPFTPPGPPPVTPPVGR